MSAIAPTSNRVSNDQDAEASIVRAVIALLGHWKLVLASVVLCWLAGAALFFAMDRQYEAVALLTAPADTADSGGAGLAGRLGGMAALAGIDLQSADVNMDVAIATFSSRSFLMKFIEEQNLWSYLYPDAWDEVRNEWGVPPAERPTLADAYAVLSDSLRVTRDRQTGLVTVTLRSTDRNRAAEWLQLLISKLNLTMRQQAEQEARKSLHFLNEEAQKTAPIEIQQSIYRMVEMQINKAMLSNVREDYAFRIIDPPVVPDEDKYVSPSKVMIAFLATLLGLLLGIAAALVLQLRRSPDATTSE